MKVLGCTGGIGAGKTYVSSVFARLGVPVYFSDDRAKELYSVSEKVRKGVVSVFGEDIYDRNMIRKDRLASMVFGNPELLSRLEAVVHPAVVEDFMDWKSRAASPYGFVIFESAILLDRPSLSGIVDKVMLVTAPLELRIQRVMLRDSSCREQVEDRIRCQSDDERRRSMSDFVIFADGKTALLPQIEKVLDYFKQ